MFAVDSAAMFGATQFLITGGTGFIGRHIVRAFLNHGARVRVFCRTPEKARRLFGDEVEIAAGDLRAAASITGAMQGCQAVVHLGATFQFGRPSRQLIENTNVAGTQHLLNAARQLSVERFVHVSSSGVLEGRSALLTERDFPDHVSVREPYRHSKWLSEQAALAAGRHGLPVIIASPTSPLGAGDEAPTPTGRIVRDYLNGRFPFSAHVGLNFIHVADLAEGIVAATKYGRAGERYLLGHHNVWLDEFLGLLARITGRSVPRLQLTRAAISLAGLVGEFGGSERVCRETAAHARRRQWFDFSKAANELGWRALTPLETTARETVEWFEERTTVRLESLLAQSDVAAS